MKSQTITGFTQVQNPQFRFFTITQLHKLDGKISVYTQARWKKLRKLSPGLDTKLSPNFFKELE
jgi:hypothetical protein